MTIDEAEKKLRYGVNELDKVVSLPRMVELREALMIAEDAMEKGKPKRPDRDEYGHLICPICGAIVFVDEYHGSYLPCCDNCGQRILWQHPEKVCSDCAWCHFDIAGLICKKPIKGTSDRFCNKPTVYDGMCDDWKAMRFFEKDEQED